MHGRDYSTWPGSPRCANLLTWPHERRHFLPHHPVHRIAFILEHPRVCSCLDGGCSGGSNGTISGESLIESVGTCRSDGDISLSSDGNVPFTGRDVWLGETGPG